MHVIIAYLETMFSTYPQTPRLLEAKQELQTMMEDAYTAVSPRNSASATYRIGNQSLSPEALNSLGSPRRGQSPSARSGTA